MKDPFALTNEDRYSSLWKRLLEYLDQQINQLRTQNDGDKDEIATANLRGRIAALKAIQSLNKELPIIPPPSDGN